MPKIVLYGRRVPLDVCALTTRQGGKLFMPFVDFLKEQEENLLHPQIKRIQIVTPLINIMV
jgi:hypothetical protein